MERTAADRYASGGPAAEIVAPNLFRAFEATAERLGSELAIRDGERELDWDELRAKVARVAGGLASLGIGKGDTVALLLPNRLEFIPSDLGAVALGAVPFSLYATSSAEQIAYVVGDAGSKLAIVDAQFIERFREARGELEALETIVVIDAEAAGEGELSFAELEAAGEGFDPTETAGAVDIDDLLTLIYTSGTTGPPKGVQLTHRNLMSLVGGVDQIVEIPERGGRVVSWLPAAHIAERGANYYLPVVRGMSVTICPDPRRIAEFLPQVKPTWFFAVPRIWEKLKSGLEAMVAGLPDERREPAQAALEAALQKVRLEQAGEEVPAELAAAVERADAAMFAPIRAQIGLDESNGVHVGAAPTPVEVLEFFHAIGIHIGELWGMSETCGVATCNPPERVKLGTVGPPIPGIEIALADDGEVLVGGPSVMAGYRNMPERTEEAFDDDWMLTGDVGQIDADGYLKIVDRKKELIINAAGKNMSPAEIEAKLKASSPLVGQAVAIGDGRPYNVALIVLDADFAPGWAKKHGVDDASLEALAAEPELEQAVCAAVASANSRLARPEQIKRFRILPNDWEPGGEELTPTMKLKRRPISDRYETEITALYDDGGLEPAA